MRVELKSTEEKVAILRLKQKWREEKIEINFKTMLKELPRGKEYFMTGSSRLIRRDDAPAERRRDWENPQG